VSDPIATPDTTRRQVLANASGLLSFAALESLRSAPASDLGCHIPPRARHVIYLFMSGGPSHVDTFDPKPELTRRHGEPIPESFVKDVHFAMIPDSTRRPRLQGSPWRFRRHGESGLEISSLFPHIAGVADHLAVIRSLHSPIFNHDPAVNLLNTGDGRVGRPTMGAWLSYGLGSPSRNFPAYVVLTSGVKVQPLLTSYWSSGFLPTRYQGVEFRNSGDPILFLSNPESVDTAGRRRQLDLVRLMNRRRFQQSGDPETLTRIQQYELAFRMQARAPGLVNISGETATTLKMYGADPAKPSFARNCLMARRMVESGIRFVQLYDMGWDSHGSLKSSHERQCQAVDRPIAALLRDLDQRGLLDETLVIWGGEFGRTPVIQGGGVNWGRDHHPHGFSMWMAGGGIRPGTVHGETDEFGFHATRNRVDVHDLHATILHTLGIDHRRLTFRHQGRDFRLTDVSGEVIRDIL
tara:strand:+ start:7011 stop:8408 length:1398 start_codon:yes stop_codon:yes gene_type:complete